MSKVLKGILLTLVLCVMLGAIALCIYAAVSKDSPSAGDDKNAAGNDDVISGTGDKYTGLFSGNSTTYTLTGDYTFTAADVKATASSGNNVTLNYLCSFDLGGHTLDLGGYSLNISAKDVGKVINFKNGKIKNGKLNVSIPKGDIGFTDTKIDDTVTYELEAASNTIRFSNAVIGGKCTVKSNTRVSVEYSSLNDITFAGSGTLAAGRGAELGEVNVSAAGATLNIAAEAKVTKVELNARANLEISGTVANVSVASTAGGSSVLLTDSATVATVLVNANNTQIDNEAGDVQVIVADSVAGTVNANGVKVTTASKADMDKYLSHTHALEVVSKTVADCEHDGVIKYECKGCGETATNTTPKFGHKYSYTIQTEPTATQDGVYIYSCSRCTSQYPVTISKADVIYYHMDVAMVEKEGSTYTTVRLQYVKDDDSGEEYYLLTETKLLASSGSFTETVYTAKLLCNSGLPEVKPTSAKHCGDWKELSISHSATAEAKTTPITGGIIRLAENGYQVVGGGKGKTTKLADQTVNFTGSCYLDEKTGKTSFVSMHELSATGNYANGATSCSGGITVNETCKNCDYTNTVNKKGHYYLNEKQILTTQCNEETDYFTDAECVVCHYHSVTYSLDSKYHSMTYVRSENVDATDLASHGFDSQGVYEGTRQLNRCALCGIEVYSYTYYTHTQADGCMTHKAYVLDYKGNEDYKPFTLEAHRSEAGHNFSYSSTTEYDSVAEAIAEFKSLTGETELLITPIGASYRYYLCKGCDLKINKRIYMHDNYGASHSDESDNTLTLYITYGDDGKTITSWSYTYTYGLSKAIERLKDNYKVTLEYGLSLSDATRGYGEYTKSNSDGTGRERIELHKEIGYNYDYTYDKNFDLVFNGYSNSGDLRVYYIGQCKAYFTPYVLDTLNGWGAGEHSIETRHFEAYVNGENCIEDQKTCAICGERLWNEHKYAYDDDLHWSHYSWGNNDLFDGAIGGLDANIHYANRCIDCGTPINASVVLKSDWVLTGDVYIKAEGISIDLNGYNIDLNGHSLVIYSYAGARVVLTNNSTNTANGTYGSMITNSSTSGVLVAATNGGTIDLGTIAFDEDVNSVFTDEADRYSLYSVLSAEGYNLPFVRV